MPLFLFKTKKSVFCKKEKGRKLMKQQVIISKQFKSDLAKPLQSVNMIGFLYS